jgi:hypothetical protein
MYNPCLTSVVQVYLNARIAPHSSAANNTPQVTILSGSSDRITRKQCSPSILTDCDKLLKHISIWRSIGCTIQPAIRLEVVNYLTMD